MTDSGREALDPQALLEGITRPWPWGSDTSKIIPDARLMAAAPDLAAALIEARSETEAAEAEQVLLERINRRLDDERATAEAERDAARTEAARLREMLHEAIRLLAVPIADMDTECAAACDAFVAFCPESAAALSTGEDPT